MGSNEDSTARRKFLLKSGATAAAAATAATTIAAQPAGAAPLSPIYLPVGPFRTYDSRKSDGKISAGQTRTLTGGNQPGDLAHVFNLTVTKTTGSGYLAVFPADETWGGTSSINWTGPNQTRANNAITGIRSDGGINIYCGGGGSAEFILDLMAVVTIVDLGALGAITSAMTVDGSAGGSGGSISSVSGDSQSRLRFMA